MGTRIDKAKVKVYEYFLRQTEPVNFLESVKELQKQGVRFSIISPNIEPFIKSMWDSGQLKRVGEDRKCGGMFIITKYGEKEYKLRKEFTEKGFLSES